MKGYDETDRVLSHADIGRCNSCLTSINSFRTETLSVFTLPSSACTQLSCLGSINISVLLEPTSYSGLPLLCLLFSSGLRDGRVAGGQRQIDSCFLQNKQLTHCAHHVHK